MQLTTPLPILSDGGFLTPPLAFEATPTSSAVSSLNMLFRVSWIALLSNTERDGLKIVINEQDLSFAGSPDNQIHFGDGLLLVVQTDFSALLLRQTESQDWECFHHPLRVPATISSKHSRLLTPIQNARDFWSASSRVPGFSEAFQESLKGVLAFWDENPTFDLAINGDRANLAWPLAINTISGHWTRLQEEVTCVIKILESKGLSAPSDLFIWMRTLQPDGTLSDLGIAPDRGSRGTPKYADQQERALFDELRPNIIAALSHPDCPVPRHHQIYHQKSSFPAPACYYYKPAPVSAHQILQTAGRIQETMTSISI